MALPEQYLMTTKNLDSFFNTLLSAQAPQRFTVRFLEQLEFKSTTDRLFVGVLKALKFIDSNSIPQERYFKFIDQTQSKQVIADAIREAYSDLFTINTKAYDLPANDVKNKFKTLLQGSKSDKVLNFMAITFVSLCKYADFSILPNKDIVTVKENYTHTDNHSNDDANHKTTHELINKKITTEMHYNIQIHLPETRDNMVYDAIFKSLKEHLL